MLDANLVSKDNEKDDSALNHNDMDSPTEKEVNTQGEQEQGELIEEKTACLPEHQYSREELLKYSKSPFSRRKPSITDPVIDGLFCWLRNTTWNYSKRSDTPTERGDDSYKRRSNDPRERVRKEQDGIVLSPQRRSFTTGCHVLNVPSLSANRSSVEKEGVGNGGSQPGAGQAGVGAGPVRRIGSGRILNRDWDLREKENSEEQLNYRAGSMSRDERYEIRRNYSGASMDKDSMRGGPRERVSRYPQERRRYEPEEPEWFSSGPTSQHDTIELRGFDDFSEGPGLKSKQKGGSKHVLRQRDTQADDVKVPQEELPASNTSPKPLEAEGSISKTDFNRNLEEYFQMDSLPILTNGSGNEENSSRSRFTQWFQHRDATEGGEEVRRATQQEELLKNMMNDLNEPMVSIPGMKDSDAYFAPISPAGMTSGNSLLEMLKSSGMPHGATAGRGQHSLHQGNKAVSIKDLEASGKVTSVEELEARMRQTTGQHQASPGLQQKKPGVHREEDLLAFRKLMLNKQAEPTELMGQVHQSAPQHQPAAVPPELVYKLMQEQQRQQQQQQEINKLLLSTPRLAPLPQFGAHGLHGALSPLPADIQLLVANAQPTPELLARPEAKAIHQGLRMGEITPQHLVQQLQNPAMQPRHRELLACILKISYGSPRPASPMMLPSDTQLLQQMMMRVPSPLPMHNAFCQASGAVPAVGPSAPLGPATNTLTVQHSGLPHRVPSPRELMVHTQNIMQGALLKKKLEEQRENYKKRQEMQRASSPNVSGGAKSPSSTNMNNNFQPQQQHNATHPGTPPNNNNLRGQPGGQVQQLSPAFTPTSVLRKMTADGGKDGSPLPADGKMHQIDKSIQLKIQQQQQLLKLQQNNRLLQQQQQNNMMRGPASMGAQWQQQLGKQQLPQGRAIVKGSGTFGGPAPFVELPYGSNQRGDPRAAAAAAAAFQQRSKLTLGSQMVQPPQYNNFQQARMQPRGVAAFPGQSNLNSNPALQLLMASQQHQQRNPVRGGRLIPGGDGDLAPSPTNQLSNWFTPEMLAQAQAQSHGQGKEMLSVEELERQQHSSQSVVN